jgi:L-fuculose-phosphate aldolase
MDTQDIRFKIAGARRILFREGCDSQTAGHVSARSPGEDAFWATPFQYFDETLPDHVIKVTFDLDLLEGTWTASPALAFHASIYRERPDVQSVIHHHGHYTSVFATTGRFIGQYNIASSLFYRDQAISFDDNDGSAVEAKRLAAALGDRSHVVLIKNHGCVVVGDSLEEATIKALMVEKAARYHIESEAIGGTELGEPEVLELNKNFHIYFLPAMWDAHFRRLRRSDPDLFEFAATH